MIKINYWLNGNLLYSEQSLPGDNLQKYRHLKNKEWSHNGFNYIMTNCNYDMFNDTIDIAIRLRKSFKYAIYVPNYTKHLIEQLEYIGYIKSEVSGEGKHLMTSELGYYYFTDCDYTGGGMGYVCENIIHASGIAAICDHTDKYQWFMFPNGECDFCENDSVIEEFGEFEGTDFPRKLTPEEIYKNLE